MAERRWHVRFGAAAELDFANILKWTAENFGARQPRVYRDTLVHAIGELADGPDVAGSKTRDEIMPSLRTLHVARHARRGSHFLMYRTVPKSTIEIVRILHDRMDPQRATLHLDPTRTPNRAQDTASCFACSSPPQKNRHSRRENAMSRLFDD